LIGLATRHNLIRFWCDLNLELDSKMFFINFYFIYKNIENKVQVNEREKIYKLFLKNIPEIFSCNSR